MKKCEQILNKTQPEEYRKKIEASLLLEQKMTIAAEAIITNDTFKHGQIGKA